MLAMLLANVITLFPCSKRQLTHADGHGMLPPGPKNN